MASSHSSRVIMNGPVERVPNQHEILMHKRLQPLHILAAEGVAPLALEPFDHRALHIGR